MVLFSIYASNFYSQGIEVINAWSKSNYYNLNSSDTFTSLSQPNLRVRVQSSFSTTYKVCGRVSLLKAGGVCVPKVSEFKVENILLKGALHAGYLIENTSVELPYIGGNGAPYSSQIISSTGVEGVTLELIGDNLYFGDNKLIFNVKGTPINSGDAIFNISFAGKTCQISLKVDSGHPTSGYGSTITDVEGNVYKTVYIGTQHWMAENLKTSLYQNGSTIPQVRLNFNWANKTLPAWCYLSDNMSNNTKFGKLYNYFAITNSSQVCPVGWHVPTSFEFELLAYNLGGRSVAGGALKNTTEWQTPNVSASNSSLFNALPGERRNDDGTFSFSGEFNEAYFWSSTIDSKYATNALQYTLNSNTAKIAQVTTLHNSAASVRCVKGSQPMPSISTVFPDQNIFTTRLEQPIRKNQSFSNVKCIVSYTNGVRGILFSSGLNGIVQDITFSSQEGISGTIPVQEIVNGAGEFIVYLSGYSSVDGNVTLYFKNGGFMNPLVIKVLHSTSGNGPTIYDGSGNSYPTVYIGSQHWMAKNLTTTKYNDGTTISNVQNGVEWKDVRTGAWSDYENNLTNGSNYGKLYNGYAMQTQKLCPTGWHIPSKVEWDTLFNYLGGIEVAGSKLKAVSSLYPSGENTDATNSSNFSGLAGGMRNVDGAFYNLAKIGYYWSSTQIGTMNIYNTSFKAFYVYYLHSQQAAVIEDRGPETRGMSVRCLKD
jgi:uncharacterized protein (TIGR02145 family)